MKHILMVCYGGGHMKVLAPLYAELVERYRVTVLALTSAGSYMRELGIPNLGFKDFAFTSSYEIQAYGQRLAADISDNVVVSKEETVAYLGSSFIDLVNHLGDEDAAYKQYLEKGRAAFLPVASLRKMIDELHVDAVVTTNAPRAERAALIVAKELGLPTICVNDNLWIRGGIADVAENQLADRICVLSESVRQELILKTSVDPDVVVVTGTPVFDAIKKTTRVQSESNVPRVLLADCDLPDVHPYLDLRSNVPGIDKAVRAELNRLAAAGILDVWFRPHPSQIYDYSAYSACQVSEHHENLHERLARTDVVVTAISTVGIEGRAMGLGLVSIEDTVWSALESYEVAGYSTGIKNPDHLMSAVIKEYSTLREESSEIYKGIASDNIVLVIEELLNRFDN